KAKPGPRFDYFHINSIDVAPDGNLIVSARNTWAAYKLERHTGRVLWRLGGKRSDFKLGPGARFEWQHDVREHDGGLVTVFDNAAAPQEEQESRALLLAPDTKGKPGSPAHAAARAPRSAPAPPSPRTPSPRPAAQALRCSRGGASPSAGEARPP